ncbi:uncharacterized protein SAPINGB_P003425 [Magnusiomyces paraingens]|uniref:Indoleamine 2,3-dioxygenase n=1 Tax=Magnusiomyces paraingens TaxID=2606893 RepID=A0A5E8BPB3_9ASCO|nr:uncharacterized protein SAPINGB_P003425 [Saprochaete ingens]VVT53143.1 unnamed protein product [Saprochaete ingens]
MLHPIPNLQDYDVSPVAGFLPDDPPLERLLDPYYEPWETIAQSLPAFVMTRQVRDYVDTRMPLLTTARLSSEPEWRRACMILSFLAHAYVWAGDQPRDHLPQQLADPWLATAAHFDLPPITSYACVCLWNFRTIYPDIPPAQWSLANLTTLLTFTGSYDESWFYLVSTAIEREGAPCLTHGIDAIAACRNGESEDVVKHLQALAEAIDSLTTTLARMFEMCDPHTFYFRIRPYLAGWKNMEDAGLPKGVRYGDEKEYRQISGGSNAQSSLIQALDILLNVEHYPTGHRRSTHGILPTQKTTEHDTATPEEKQKSANFIHEMRKYMPRKHREFLEALTRVSHIRDYVVAHSEETPALVISYDACLAMLRTFRDKHIQIVSRYIIIQARKAQKLVPKKTAVTTPGDTKREGLAAADSETQRGTGGTALIPFLKQARDETGDPAASTWGRRLLADTSRTLNNPRTLPVLPAHGVPANHFTLGSGSGASASASASTSTAEQKKDKPVEVAETSMSAFSRLKNAVLGSPDASPKSSGI